MRCCQSHSSRWDSRSLLSSSYLGYSTSYAATSGFEHCDPLGEFSQTSTPRCGSAPQRHGDCGPGWRFVSGELPSSWRTLYGCSVCRIACLTLQSQSGRLATTTCSTFSTTGVDKLAVSPKSESI